MVVKKVVKKVKKLLKPKVEARKKPSMSLAQRKHVIMKKIKDRPILALYGQHRIQTINSMETSTLPTTPPVVA